MGIFKKIGDLARSNINAFLDKVEDKKKLLDLAIFELNESKKHAKSLLIKTSAAIKTAEHRVKNLESEIDGLKEKAENFLRAGDEEKTKEILGKKQALMNELAAHKQELLKEQKTVDTINHGLAAIDEKISALKSKAANAASQHTIASDDSFDTFRRMEEKIVSEEYEVDALNELLKESEKKEVADEVKPSTTFDKHSDPKALEKELSDMKKKLND